MFHVTKIAALAGLTLLAVQGGAMAGTVGVGQTRNAGAQMGADMPVQVAQAAKKKLPKTATTTPVKRNCNPNEKKYKKQIDIWAVTAPNARTRGNANGC